MIRIKTFFLMIALSLICVVAAFGMLVLGKAYRDAFADTIRRAAVAFAGISQERDNAKS